MEPSKSLRSALASPSSDRLTAYRGGSPPCPPGADDDRTRTGLGVCTRTRRDGCHW
jgi:hypothetical protein